MAKNGQEFTETERKILDLLEDGKPHRRKEVILTFGDEFTSRAALSIHLHRIRKVLNPKGQDVICQFLQRGYWYRWVINYTSGRE